MGYESIQIFACDYRKNVEWNLPYIRIGDIQSDAALNIGNDIENNKYLPDLSELDKIWFVWKHIKEFGNPEYVGFFHYRRFLSTAINIPIVNIRQNDFNANLCIKPNFLLKLILDNQCVGSCFLPLKVVDVKDHDDSELIWNQMVAKEPTLKDPILCKKCFDIFYQKCPDNLKSLIKKSFRQHQQYLCNIFVLRNDLFNELCSIIFPTLVEFASEVGDFFKRNYHPRWLGYFSERLISCYLHTLQMSGKKILHLPLVTIEAEKHNKVVKDNNGLLKEIK